MVEDMHTAYWEKFGGGCAERKFIELCKHLIDDSTAYTLEVAHRIHQLTLSMHFYDAIVAFERGGTA